MKLIRLVSVSSVVASALLAVSCLSTLESAAAVFSGDSERITDADASKAMRDALVEGASSAAAKLSPKDGYFGDAAVKILFPPQAKTVIDAVEKIPDGRRLVDDVVLRLNRAAEESAREIEPIFADAIGSMTISEAIEILKGGDTSATEYLRKKTGDSLSAVYRPKIQSSLDKPLVAGVSAQNSWDRLIAAYNKAGAVANAAARLAKKREPMPPVEVDLASYATERALDGAFLKMADEERKIRANPLSYASSMIKKVFGALKDGKL